MRHTKPTGVLACLLVSFSLSAQFGNPITIDEDFVADAFTVADFDGDQDLDIYYLYEGQYWWQENQEENQFSVPVVLALSGFVSRGRLVDMDSDGDLDWVYYDDPGGDPLLSKPTGC